MADYRELLRRAIDALPENNGTARRAVYEKARSALVTQLHAIDPPIPPRDITQHRLTLEDCIRQVEQEATEKLLQGLSHREQEEVVEETAPEPSTAEEAQDDAVMDAAPSPEDMDVEPEAADEPAVATPEEDITETAPEDISADEEPAGAEEVVPQDDSTEPASDDNTAAEHVVDEESVDDSFEQAPIGEDFAAETEATDDDISDAASDDTDFAEPDTAAESDDAPTEAPKSSDVLEPDHSSAEDADVAEEQVDDSANDDAEEAQDDDVEAPLQDVEETSDETSIDDLVEQLETSTDDQNDYRASSVDDVIAQARAAAAVDAPIPNVSAEKPSSSTNIEAALSSVREVDVDLDDPSTADADNDDAQAAIDRALMALDREAEGKHDADADEALMDESSSGTITAATRDEPEMIEDSPEFVEDEQTGGGGGLLVFFGVFVLLIALLGGGTYWAWREGYVNLDPIFKQVGLSEFIVGEPADNATANDDQPSDQADTPSETNVRDVTPGNTETSTPAESNTARLTPEVDDSSAAADEGDAPVAADDNVTNPDDSTPTTDDSATTDVAETPTTSDTPADESTDTATNDDARLPSADDTTATDETPENPLNVEDPNTQAAAAGAQSLLIEEQTSGSGGAVPFSGQTEWSREVDELGLPTIRAVASIPARNLSVDVLIRKNSDEALPASHLIEVNFSVTDSFLGGSIASLPGVLMKNQELAQGTTLVGASVRIVDNSFLFAMSGAENDVARNIELLGQNGWLDLPLIYSTGRKAILTLEKGARGTELFEEVLAEWAEN
ncbi:hypothetical protein [Maritalea myrionectae]|uniref:hypothetical protein n=1 Tax=Maritalea myrionectae TaxID=454601 RepID=UPI0004204024|nr:hypothetical protein [Maritalea myrionectae]